MSEIKITDNSAEVLRSLTSAKERALEAIGLQAEGYAKMLAPVDTGRLRNSISHTTNDEAAYIGTNVEYAAYQELGTSKMAAQPYLRPAVENHVDEYKAIAERYLKDG